MDKRSWLWKKKPSDKQLTTNASDNPASSSDKPAKEEKKPKYVQISMESYVHLTGLENQLKSYEEQVQGLEDEVKELAERLSEADAEIVNKDNMVKQHTKVAEEAVSGWEKAEAEAAALKNHLESVTLLKLTAEDRASHLGGALKECMKQIRNLKEEHDLKLQEVALSKAKLYDKMKLELEDRLFSLDHELLRAAAENDAISRSLDERSDMVIQLSKEKAQAEAEIEILRSNIETCEKEVHSLRYELHIARKEAEICSEEKSISLRSAEVANKQYLEAVKKSAKLEAECQRLRVLVRKKLPGPATIAQMKLEVDSIGRDYGESRSRKSPGRFRSPHLSQTPEFSLENSHKYSSENELLTERLMAMEEETRMLKDALAKRTNELQAARGVYALTASRENSEQLILVKSTESQIEGVQSHNLPSFPSSSELGIDDNISSAGSWCTGLMSELSHVKKEKNVDRIIENTSARDLMDDFLEMEKLACSANECNRSVSDADVPPDNKTSVGAEHTKTEGSVLGSFSSVELQRVPASDQELKLAASRVCEFIVILGREAKLGPAATPGGASLNAKIDLICAKYMDGPINPVDFVLDISHVFYEASKLQLNVQGVTRSVSETSITDCIDKVALPENKAAADCGHFYDTLSDLDVPNDASLVPISESSVSAWKCSKEEFEQLQMDRDNLADNLARCMENYENTRMQLQEREHVLAEVNSQLSSAQKSNSLADTQLKCMAESYKSLETQAEELQAEVNRLHARIEGLENELQEVRISHLEAHNRCKDLQEQLESVDDSRAPCSEDKASQEELAEKLAECQETIFLLGKQLKSLRPQPEAITSPDNGRVETASYAEESAVSRMESPLMDDYTDASLQYRRTGLESPLMDVSNPLFSPDYRANHSLLRSPSPLSSRHPKHRQSKSYSSSSSANTPERQPRGFVRFFSSSTKGKLNQQ